MRTRLAITILVLITVLAGMFTFFAYFEKYLEMFERQVKISSEKMGSYVKTLEAEMKDTELFPFSDESSSLSNLAGYLLIKDNGTIASRFNVSNSFFEKYGNIYKYAMINGKYVSPFFVSSDGKATILLAVKTADQSYVALALVNPVKSSLKDAYLVDGSALGVSLDGSGKWKNFLSLLSINRKRILIRSGVIYFVEPINVGPYLLVVKRSLWSVVLSSNKTLFYGWPLVFLSLFLLFFAFERSMKKKMKPLNELSELIKDSDEFRKFENENVKGEAIFKYNELVEKYEKLKEDHTEISNKLKETNSEVTGMNTLFVEFSILFNEVKSGRKDLEEALKIAFRRMLDFSKPITGIGMRYAKMEIYLGTVNSFNFENETDGKISLELKTEYRSARYVVSADRFTMNERTREMVKTLLYYLTAFLSIHEAWEMSKNTMKYDPLTSLLTRQEFENMVKREEALAKRENFPLSFMMLDVKRMRKFNENYGKLNGDSLLKYIANVLVRNTRFTDITARYGEDAFIVCFHGMKKEDCLKKQEKIISQVMKFRYEVNIKSVALSYPIDGDNVSALVSKLEELIDQFEN